jgi:hypothetical protein
MWRDRSPLTKIRLRSSQAVSGTRDLETGTRHQLLTLQEFAQAVGWEVELVP